MLRVSLLALVVLTQAGCVAEIVFGAGSLIASGVSIYQRHEDRGVQKEQNDEIRMLREATKSLEAEIARLLARWPAPMPIGGYVTPNVEPGITAPPLTLPLSEGGVVLPQVQER